MYIWEDGAKKDYYGEEWWKAPYCKIFKNRTIVNIK